MRCTIAFNIFGLITNIITAIQINLNKLTHRRLSYLSPHINYTKTLDNQSQDTAMGYSFKVHPLDPSGIPLTLENILGDIQIIFDGEHKQPALLILVLEMPTKSITGEKIDPLDHLGTIQFPKLSKKEADAIINRLTMKEWKGKRGSTEFLHFIDNPTWEAVCVSSIGSLNDIKTQNIIDTGKSTGSAIKSAGYSYATIMLPEKFGLPYTEKFLTGLYESLAPECKSKYQSESPKPSKLKAISIMSGNEKCALEKISKRALDIAQGTRIAAELTFAPANYCQTHSLAESAKKIADMYGLEYMEMNQEELVERKMGAYLAVHKGSVYPAKLIQLTYTSQDTPKKHGVFIGKGLCFDSGGYNIKSAASQIELMKMDMGGCAACLGAAAAIGASKPPGVKLTFISALAENMVDSESYRPGDVVTASNGKTIEVSNTDAEGRLTLADALVYGESLNPDFIVDFATLTGACVVALGTSIAALFSNNNKFAQHILECSRNSGDQVWELPLAPEYREMIDSKIADLNNLGGKSAGTITAALFLNEFVKKAHWAHIDIAGTALKESDCSGTGFGVKIMYEMAHSIANMKIED